MKSQQQQIDNSGPYNNNNTEISQLNKDISSKSTKVGESIPVDNSVNHYELPNLTTCTHNFNN